MLAVWLGVLKMLATLVIACLLTVLAFTFIFDN